MERKRKEITCCGTLAAVPSLHFPSTSYPTDWDGRNKGQYSHTFFTIETRITNLRYKVQ
jgi:hypothetical protein